MIKWFLEQKLWVKIIVLLFIITIVALMIIFIPKYNGPEENCTFINERVNLHEEYYVSVTDVTVESNVFYYKNKNDTEKSELIGTDTHFIIVKVKIEHQLLSTPLEDHSFDLDDFKLKDHTGVQLKNINFFSKENGLALETTDFSTRKPLEDYGWFGKSIESGNSMDIELIYQFSKRMSVYNTLMVLEIDLFSGRSNGKAGTDIVLAYRETQK